MVQGLTENDLVLCLISGGGSALLTLPAEGLTLEDKQRINKALLNSGANISEMNCVRKHLSRIKGGRLAAACAPARVVTLTISDVPGDDPSIIASGPTVPDATSCADAVAILQRYGIEVPGAIMSQGSGKQGAAPAHQRIAEHPRLARQAADLERALFAADIIQTIDEIDVDQMCRLSQPKIHHRHQALTASENLAVRTDFLQ